MNMSSSSQVAHQNRASTRVWYALTKSLKNPRTIPMWQKVLGLILCIAGLGLFIWGSVSCCIYWSVYQYWGIYQGEGNFEINESESTTLTLPGSSLEAAIEGEGKKKEACTKDWELVIPNSFVTFEVDNGKCEYTDKFGKITYGCMDAKKKKKIFPKIFYEPSSDKDKLKAQKATFTEELFLSYPYKRSDERVRKVGNERGPARKSQKFVALEKAGFKVGSEYYHYGHCWYLKAERATSRGAFGYVLAVILIISGCCVFFGKCCCCNCKSSAAGTDYLSSEDDYEDGDLVGDLDSESQNTEF